LVEAEDQSQIPIYNIGQYAEIRGAIDPALIEVAVKKSLSRPKRFVFRSSMRATTRRNTLYLTGEWPPESGSAFWFSAASDRGRRKGTAPQGKLLWIDSIGWNIWPRRTQSQ
jgi:hypothetical protein